MKLRTIRYYIKEAFRSLIKNRLMTAASVFAVASSIFIVSIFYILGANFSHIIRILEEQMAVVAIIEEDQTSTDITRIEGQILALQHVSYVVFISRDEALENFRLTLGEAAGALYGLELDNPLRDSFVVQLTDLAYQREVALAIRGFSGVASVNTTDIAEILHTLSNIVQLISFVLVLVLGLISVTIIINTIRITVNSRQTEINIMKYVGATDWFIRWPFILEGILIGLIGAAVPATIIWLGYGAAINAILSVPGLGFLSFISAEDIYMYVFPFSLILGSFIGLIGSSVSVRRHLKV